MSRPDAWMLAASCAARPDLPWTTDTHLLPPVAVDAMRDVCASCPVVLDCLAAVDSLDVTGGWWAGADRDPHPIVRKREDGLLPARDVVAVSWRALRTRSGRVVGDQGVLELLGGAA